MRTSLSTNDFWLSKGSSSSFGICTVHWINCKTKAVNIWIDLPSRSLCANKQKLYTMFLGWHFNPFRQMLPFCKCLKILEKQRFLFSGCVEIKHWLKLLIFSHISGQFLSTLPENIRKPLVFWYFQEVQKKKIGWE